MSTTYDVLIVGSGPTGTAAAFRAKEMGLSTCVIDQNDVLSVVQYWADHDKVVGANYGAGGKKVPFPHGDKLVQQLFFEDQTPARSLLEVWKGIYQREGIEHRSGLELLGLTDRPDGVRLARCAARLAPPESRDVEIVCRTVVLALGRDVPRKLEIVGDATGINYRLGDPKRFVGQPACVVGGGMSAAEAVIAISNAKAAANDSTEVFWSYYRRAMRAIADGPALAPEFYAAFANGNIRYFPFSEAFAILKIKAGVDREVVREVVALRANRVEADGYPATAQYYEFAKAQVLACIGASIPERFLESLGISLYRDPDDANTKMMAVSPLLESQRNGVFVAGDLLSDVYVQTRQWPPSFDQATEVDHPACVKNGFVDGVVAIEAIARRLRGDKDAAIEQQLALLREDFRERHAKRLEDQAERRAASSQAQQQVTAPKAAFGARFARVDANGSLGEELGLALGVHWFGRNAGDRTYPDDDLMKDQHCAIRVDVNGCVVSTEGAAAVAFLVMGSERTIKVGSMLKAGGQRLRIDQAGERPMLSILGNGTQIARRLSIPDKGTYYGRQGSDTVQELDAEDTKLSRKHFFLQREGVLVKVRDGGSKAGTLLAIVDDAVRLIDRDDVWIGRQRLRFLGIGEISVPEKRGDLSPPTQKTPAPPPAWQLQQQEQQQERPQLQQPVQKPEPKGEEPSGSRVAFSIRIGDKVLPTTAGTSILDVLKKAGLVTEKPDGPVGGVRQTEWTCGGQGRCGNCIVKVLGPQTGLSPLKKRPEKQTIDIRVPEIAEGGGPTLDPAGCRLACQASVQSDVTVEQCGAVAKFNGE